MKKIKNKLVIKLARIFNVPIYTVNDCGPLRENEIETLTYGINNSLFRKRARNLLFERIRALPHLKVKEGLEIISKVYARHIDYLLAALIVDKMLESKQYHAFYNLPTEGQVKMIRKVGFPRFIDFFDDGDHAFDNFLAIFEAFDKEEKAKSDNVAAYAKYFSEKGLKYVETIGAKPIIDIIKATVPAEKARPYKFGKPREKGDRDWAVFFSDKLVEKLYIS